MILGGRRYSIGPDDYVFGALAVYIDLVNIFISVTSAFNIFSGWHRAYTNKDI